MASVKDLYNAIRKIDLAGSSSLEGTAYDMTYNDTLGLPDRSPFIVLAPFDSLPKDDKAFAGVSYEAGEMPIQKAFKAVLKEGHKLSTGQDTLFIDIADLDEGDTSFFTEGAANSVAEAIADLVNNQVPANVRPVIRFLRGARQVDNNFWKSRQPSIEAIFWKNDDNGNKVPRITHQKAELHMGFYSPTFKLSQKDETSIKTVLNWGLRALSWVGGAAWTTEQIDALLNSIFNDLTFSASWNHGKILAIGGKTMMTGGINYWQEYTSRERKIIDMQAKVTGDAAISAHAYVDYFWKYLNSAHGTDLGSFKRTIMLCNKVPEVWKSDTKVPLFKDTVKYTRKTSGIQVLSIARIGDVGSKILPAYPAQIVDALRDLFVNIHAPALGAANDFQGLVHLIQRSDMTHLIRLVGQSPAAWASRIARVNAVANANSTVYMSGQMIVGALQSDEPAYKEMVKSFNKNKPKEQLWDGYLWPYDLLLAFATLILKLRDTKKNSEENGIAIVLGNKLEGGGWGDSQTVADLTSKIVQLVQGLDTTLNQADAHALVFNWFKVKRIGEPYGNTGPNSIHTKTVCVDKRLLYVGSDNLYPNYNEEHGIWVDDTSALADWVNNYWLVVWKRASEPKGDDLHVSSFPTDIV